MLGCRGKGGGVGTEIIRGRSRRGERWKYSHGANDQCSLGEGQDDREMNKYETRELKEKIGLKSVRGKCKADFI